MVKQVQAAPATPGNSYSSSTTDHLSAKPVAEDINSGVRNACNTGEKESPADLELLLFKVFVYIGNFLYYSEIFSVY